jgi:hypothetical protein
VELYLHSTFTLWDSDTWSTNVWWVKRCGKKWSRPTLKYYTGTFVQRHRKTTKSHIHNSQYMTDTWTRDLPNTKLGSEVRLLLWESSRPMVTRPFLKCNVWWLVSILITYKCTMIQCLAQTPTGLRFFLKRYLQSFANLWPTLMGFSIYIQRHLVGLLGRGISRPLPTQDNRTQKHADTHPCPKHDSNLRSQCSSGRRQYLP